MTLSPKEALNEAAKTLNMQSDTFVKPHIHTYSIVEFCSEYLDLSLQETVDLSRKLVYDMPVVCITEGNWGDTLQNFLGTKASQYGNKMRANLQNRIGVGSTGNAPKIQQSWAHPIKKLQDTLNTKSSALRNSPMIMVKDDAKGINKYIAFPDLDLERPGHKRILDSIIQSLSKSGATAQQVNVAAPERAAAQTAGNYAEISAPDTSENKKEAVEASLQQLEDLINNNKETLNRYSFISNEELEALQQQIAQAAGQASQTISAASQENTADLGAMEQEAAKAVSQPGQPNQQPQQTATQQPSAYEQELGKIQSAASLAGNNQQASTAPAPEGTGTEGMAQPTTVSAPIAPTNNQEVSVNTPKSLPTSQFTFNASAGPGNLQRQLTNVPKGTIEDTLKANKEKQLGIPPTVSPSNVP